MCLPSVRSQKKKFRRDLNTLDKFSLGALFCTFYCSLFACKTGELNIKVYITQSFWRAFTRDSLYGESDKKYANDIHIANSEIAKLFLNRIEFRMGICIVMRWIKKTRWCHIAWGSHVQRADHTHRACLWASLIGAYHFRYLQWSTPMSRWSGIVDRYKAAAY